MGCFNDDVLFVHIPKCGGWSCKTYMQQNLPGVLMPKDEGCNLPIGHVRLADIERFTGRPPSSWKLIVAVVRNPYEQQVSQFSFWATRYLNGSRHIHDIVTGKYVLWPTVIKDVAESGGRLDGVVWYPNQIDFTGWVMDPMSDFHVWYQQHIGYRPGMTLEEQERARLTSMLSPVGRNRYQDFGGVYRFWLEVGGEIPDNVSVICQERLDTDFPAALAPYVEGTSVPMTTQNTSPHGADTMAYYTPEAARVVEDKFQWAFEHHYRKWLYSDLTV